MDSYTIVLGASLIVIASFFFNTISRKTNIPSVLMLMILGYVLGKVFGIDVPSQETILSSLGTVAVILIVLEAGLDLKVAKEKWPILWRSLLLSIGQLLLTSFAIAGVISIFLELDFLHSMIYAVPLSVLSSAIIIPSVGGLIEKKREFLIYESSLSDIFGIILFYILCGLAESDVSVSSMFGMQFLMLLLAILLGFVVSYGLVLSFPYLKGHARLFLLIAVLIGLYAAAKMFFHLYAALFIILIFGLVINNKDRFFPGRLKVFVEGGNFDEILKDFKTLSMESAFVVRTFFFVIFGMTFNLGELMDYKVWLISILALVLIYGLRWVGLRVLFKKDIFPELWIAPRGLISIVLFMAIPASIISENFPAGIVLLCILISNFVMTYGLITSPKREEESVEVAEPELVSEVVEQ